MARARWHQDLMAEAELVDDEQVRPTVAGRPCEYDTARIRTARIRRQGCAGSTEHVLAVERGVPLRRARGPRDVESRTRARGHRGPGGKKPVTGNAPAAVVPDILARDQALLLTQARECRLSRTADATSVADAVEAVEAAVVGGRARIPWVVPGAEGLSGEPRRRGPPLLHRGDPDVRNAEHRLLARAGAIRRSAETRRSYRTVPDTPPSGATLRPCTSSPYISADQRTRTHPWGCATDEVQNNAN
ncbi:hypothetical protein ACFVW2_16540 [Streptomyces sp. NPDC058171]